MSALLSETQLLQKIDTSRLPAHVAIIMDGNGRWAKERHLPRLWGHRVGSRTVREIVRTSGELGIKVLTLYAFSTENWTRPSTEISGLMRLLRHTLKREQKNLDENNVSLHTIGDTTQLPSEVQSQLSSTIDYLSSNTGLKLVLALNYGGRQEILRACNIAIEEAQTPITESILSSHLYTAPWPDPDLVIRTSGELRVSNFLLWQIAYAEIHVTPVYWPEFKKKNFYEAILDFQSRDRRFGAVR